VGPHDSAPAPPLRRHLPRGPDARTRPAPATLRPPAPVVTALSPLASFFAGHPTAARTVRDQHVDDGRGKCRRCGTADGRGSAEWPCTLRTAADRGLAARRGTG
jgi:hypothetical protein